MAKTGVREQITLACTECKRRNYRLDEVEAEHARPRRAQEVLPVVQAAHARTGRRASGPPDPSRAAREARGRERSMAGGGGGGGGEPLSRVPAAATAAGRACAEPGRHRPAAYRNGFIRFIDESIGELQQGRVAGPEPGHAGHGRRDHRLRDRRDVPLRRRPGLQASFVQQSAAGTVRERACSSWYVINTYSGHENKVKANLEHRIDSMNQRPRFRRVVVPTEQVIETKDGQKVQTEKRVLPGYVLVNMDLNDDAWTVVKNTPGVTGFVGAGSKPVPLSQPEVDRILHTGAAHRRAPAHAGRVLARRVGEGNLRAAVRLRRRDRRGQRRLRRS